MSLAGRILRTRAVVRAPVPLFEHGLGWVLGGRFLMLEHTGRSSGLPRHVVLEVIGRPDHSTYRVVSGLGRSAQWFRNISRDPRVRVSVGERRRVPAVATVLSPGAGSAALADYARAHPTVWRTLSGALLENVEPGDENFASIPVVDFRLEPAESTDPDDAGATVWSRLVGPMNRAESAAVLVPAALGAAAIAVSTGRRRAPAKAAVAAALGFDLIGGMVEFQIPTDRRHYADTSRRARRTFAALHLQPFAMPLIGEGGWSRSAGRYLMSMAGTVLLPRVPQDSRRVFGLIGTVAAVALDRLGAGGTERWFGPAYLTKMIAGHASLPDPPG